MAMATAATMSRATTIMMVNMEDIFLRMTTTGRWDDFAIFSLLEPEGYRCCLVSMKTAFVKIASLHWQGCPGRRECDCMMDWWLLFGSGGCLFESGLGMLNM